MPNLETIPRESMFVVDNFKNITYQDFEKFILQSKRFNPGSIYEEIEEQRQIFLKHMNNVING